MPYTVPVYTSDPVWCDITYSYTITDPSGDPVLSFDALTQTFTFDYSSDVILSGSDFIDYTVTVTGEAGNITPTTGSSSFILKVKNPCIDPAYLTIATTPLPVGETYILHDFDQTTKYEFTHTAFVINANPTV